MIRVNVKLFGTLAQRFRDYDVDKGLVVEMHEAATVTDLMRRLRIGVTDGGVAVMDGRVTRGDDLLRDGACVQILQQMHGG